MKAFLCFPTHFSCSFVIFIRVGGVSSTDYRDNFYWDNQDFWQGHVHFSLLPCPGQLLGPPQPLTCSVLEVTFPRKNSQNMSIKKVWPSVLKSNKFHTNQALNVLKYGHKFIYGPN
jgi:hypothetical protein